MLQHQRQRCNIAALLIIAGIGWNKACVYSMSYQLRTHVFPHSLLSSSFTPRNKHTHKVTGWQSQSQQSNGLPVGQFIIRTDTHLARQSVNERWIEHKSWIMNHCVDAKCRWLNIQISIRICMLYVCMCICMLLWCCQSCNKSLCISIFTYAQQ